MSLDLGCVDVLGRTDLHCAACEEARRRMLCVSEEGDFAGVGFLDKDYYNWLINDFGACEQALSLLESFGHLAGCSPATGTVPTTGGSGTGGGGTTASGTGGGGGRNGGFIPFLAAGFGLWLLSQ